MTTAALSYDEVVAGCRRLVAENVPSYAAVAVVSKGDDRLTEFGGRRAWHLPSMLDGTYAGHHPANGAEAVSHLEMLRTRGAEFLLIPRTSLWWLDHYPELREYLADRCPTAADDPAAGRVYRIGRSASPGGRSEAVPQRGRSDAEKSLARNVSELVEALLPPHSTVEVLGMPGEVPLQLGERSVRRSSVAALEAALDVLANQKGFLVLPRDACRDLDRDAHADRLLRERCRTVTDQRHVCRILEVRGAPEADAPVRRQHERQRVESWPRRIWRRWTRR